MIGVQVGEEDVDLARVGVTLERAENTGAEIDDDR